MEQILIRNLPAGPHRRASGPCETAPKIGRSEARDLLAKALQPEPETIVDLLSMDEGADIDFEPGRLGLPACSADL